MLGCQKGEERVTFKVVSQMANAKALRKELEELEELEEPGWFQGLSLLSEIDSNEEVQERQSVIVREVGRNHRFGWEKGV